MVENLARRCGGFLKSLSLNGCQVRIGISQTCFKIFSSSQNVGDSALCTFSQTCCNIETLDLSSCKKLSDKTFHCLAQHCTKLATLNISSWPQSHQESRRVNRKYLGKQSRDDGAVINNNSRDISDIELEQDYSDGLRV